MNQDAILRYIYLAYELLDLYTLIRLSSSPLGRLLVTRYPELLPKMQL